MKNTPHAKLGHLQSTDPEMATAIFDEAARQTDGLELIASENYTSAAVHEAVGSVLTNKYAEGIPGRRYYGGCEHVDVVENLARNRACELYGAEYANVQPHSGASANTAVYMAELEPGDTILGLDLAHGGHLTHGMHLNISGMLYNVLHYGVKPDDHRIDLDQMAQLAKDHKPKLIVGGHSAYPREVPHAEMRQISDDCGAKLMIDMAHYAGLVAGGEHDNPVPYADYVTSTSHKTLRGPRGGFVLTKKDNAKDLNRAVFPGLQGGPLMHVIAGKGVCFHEASQPEFRQYARQVKVNAQALADQLKQGGLTLASGGTDNHLMLVDVTSIDGMTGKIAEELLDMAGITVNKNMIPFDQRKPLDPSGIRLGTAALTTRGMEKDEMVQVGDLILRALHHADDHAEIERIRGDVQNMTQHFPVPLTHKW